MYIKLFILLLVFSISNAKMLYRTDGYVKLDSFYDSRQVFGVSDDQSLFFPRPKVFDPSGKDINKHGQLQQTAIESRLQMFMASDQEFFGFLPFASIEGNFTGNFLESPDILSVIYSYFGLLSGPLKIYFGQYWHPLSPQDCYPPTVAYGCGIPINPYSRQPQIRFVITQGNFELWLTALAQRDFQSFGPLVGGFSAEYIRNSAVPNFDIQLRTKIGEHCLLGLCGDFKRIVPRLETDRGYKAHEAINSYIAAAYCMLTYERSVFQLKGAFAQNANDLIMLSGYGVKTVDPETDQRTYSNTAVAAWWTDYAYRFKWGDIGFFAGISKNLGSFDSLYINPATNQPLVYNYEPRIDIECKWMPRIVWRSFPVVFGFELEYNYTTYGSLNAHAIPINTIAAQSVRVLLGSYYYF